MNDQVPGLCCLCKVRFTRQGVALCAKCAVVVQDACLTAVRRNFTLTTQTIALMLNFAAALRPHRGGLR